MELVVTDDGSTDATLEIVEAFARSAPFKVRVSQNEVRLGYADNFLKAASLCQENLIAFCDQDDIWLEQKLSICSRCFGDPDVMLVTHSGRVIAQSGILGSYFPNYSKMQVLDISTCDPIANWPGFAMVIKRTLLDISDWRSRPRMFYAHDRWLWLLAVSTGRVVRIPHVLTFYRQHERNVCGLPEPRSLVEQMRSIASIVEYEGAADGELVCSHILSIAARQHPDRAERLQRAANHLERRSKFHHLRDLIYKKESDFPLRAIAFIRIFFGGGYLPDISRSRLGLRAAVKDIVLGVPRLHKLISR